MNIWVIRDGEPLPTDPGGRRLMRMGMLCKALTSRGHHVVWFTSSFDHYRKRQRPPGEQSASTGPLDIVQVAAPGYPRNIALQRIRHNRVFAARWRAMAAQQLAPDVLVTDIPTTETAQAVARFGAARKIPVVLSIRDLWPDFFADYLPPALRRVAGPLIALLTRQAVDAARLATSLVGISDNYLAWGLARAGRERGPFDRVFPLGYDPLPPPTIEAIAALRARLGIGAGVKIVSFVGSWGATYDLNLVAATARQLAARDDLVFVIAGDATARPALVDAMRALPNVRLSGWISGEDIATLVSASAVGLLPYGPAAPQGLPNKVFEYMAYGAYQVSTLGGEVESLYAATDTGVVCQADPVAFAAAIVTALTHTGDRDARIAQFRRQFHADMIYAEMVAHIEALAGAGATMG